MTAINITPSWAKIAFAGQTVEIENRSLAPIFIMTSTGAPSDTDGISLDTARSQRQLNLKQDLWARTSPDIASATLSVMSGLVSSFWPVPGNISPPFIVGGPNVGKSVFVQLRGKWNGGPYVERTYQWARDGVAITGATGEGGYTLQAADVGHAISVIETATNATGSASISSGAITATS